MLSVSNQVTQVLDALAALLSSAAAGCRLADVCFVSLYLSTMSDFDTVNQAYCRAFDASSPHARCCTQVIQDTYLIYHPEIPISLLMLILMLIVIHFSQFNLY